jgi:cytochrome c-type biogenesis protein CcmF
MDEIVFAGEHLLPGNIGKLAVFISLAASLLSFISYAFGVNDKEDPGFWNRLGRLGFSLHGLAVAVIFLSLFYIIQQHYFEYQYAWQHSSLDLPLEYMISCFWEGQEGSFLLWMVWHVVIGIVLMFRSGTWEAPVMAVLALAQLMLSTMLLGIDVLGLKIGSSPFILLRDAQPEIFSIPVMAVVGVENYLTIIRDGNGLNPLLQNYWMVIHPPTLFLGFAAAIVPFAYAVAGLWTGKAGEWVKPALPWTLFGVMVLGAGIIMGGFWAYESLSFGGYWAWDPVENASLIPWLLLIASAHTMLIFIHTKKALYISYILAVFSFLLVLYATFLNRSGILGNTSVHSFTDLGMSGQLLLFFFLFVALPSFFALKSRLLANALIAVGIAALSANIAFDYQPYLSIPAGIMLFIVLFVSIWQRVPRESQADEEISSREFWMFIGSLTFVISCFQIIINTSIPVWNKLFGLDKAPPVDVISYYNQWQLPIAVVIGIMMGFGQFLKYRKTPGGSYRKKIAVSLLASLACTILLSLLFGLSNPLLVVLLFSGVFAVAGNMVYLAAVIKGRMRFAGGSVAHVGFGLMILGVISSGSGKKVISVNQSGIDISAADPKEQRENLLLWKNQPVRMGSYEVVYAGDTLIAPNTYYKVDYRGLDPETGEYTGEFFQLRPNAQANPKMGLVSNPDTRHYMTYDVFTHVTQVPDKESNLKMPFSNFKAFEMKIGDTVITNNGRVILKTVTPNVDKASFGMEDADHILMAELQVITLFDTLYARPVFAIKGDMFSTAEDVLHEAGLQFKMTEIKTDSRDFSATKFVIETGEKPPVQDYIILKAIVFPYINLLWGGTIVMVIGFLLSIFQRAGRKSVPERKSDLV